MDSSAHKLHSIGSTDNAGDVPASVRASVTNAEEWVFLNSTLGLPSFEIARLDNNQVAQLIAERVFQTVGSTRASISQIGLQNALSDRINRAMQLIENRGLIWAFDDQERVSAIASAAYESIPSDVMDQLIMNRIPARVAYENDHTTSNVDLSVNLFGALRNIRINIERPFWRTNSFNSAQDLEIALRRNGVTPREIGLVRGLPNADLDRPLTNVEAANLAASTFSLTNVPAKMGEQTEKVQTQEKTTQLKVNIFDFMNATTTNEAPAGLQLMPIRQMNDAEILQVLEYQNANNKRVYWEKYVEPAGIDPADVDTQSGQSFATAARNIIRHGYELWKGSTFNVDTGGGPFPLTIDIPLLTQARTPSASVPPAPPTCPPGLEDKDIKSLSASQVRELLLFDAGFFTYPFWSRFIRTPNATTPDQPDNITGMQLNEVVGHYLAAHWTTHNENTETIHQADSFDLKLKIDELLTEKIGTDAPAGFQDRFVCTMTAGEISDLLEYQGKKGDFPYWKKFVDAKGRKPADMDGLKGVTLSAVVMQMLLDKFPHSAINPIGTQDNRTLFDIHRNIREQSEENRELLDKLRMGSENSAGAAMAASIAMNDKTILEATSSSAGAQKIKENLDVAKAKLGIHELLKKLHELNLNFQIQKMSNGSEVNLQKLLNERGSLENDFKAIGTNSKIPTWESDFAKGGSLAQSPMDMNAPPPPAIDRNVGDRRDAQTKINTELKRVGEEIARYQSATNILDRILLEAKKAKIADKLKKYMSEADGVKKAGLKPEGSDAFNAAKAADDITAELGLESVEDLKKTIEKEGAKLKEAKEGGSSGDALQQKIFEEHFKRQGLSEIDAQKNANYLYSRSLIDNELRGQIDQLQDDVFTHHEIGHTVLDDLNPVGILREKKDWKVTGNIAQSVGLMPPYIQNAGIPVLGWETRSYPQLITAYYSFKKLYEGGGPAYINSPGSRVYLAQMCAISSALADRHVTMLINDFGNDLPDEEQKKLRSRKTLSLELLEKMLTGEAPDRYAVRIDQILANVDRGTHRYRRASYRGITTASKATAGAVAYAAKGTVNKTKAVGAGVWNQKKNIMACAALTALGGPLGLAVFAGYKLWNAPNLSTAA